MPQKKTRKNKPNYRNFYRTPTPYPFSPMQNISGIVSSSYADMKAVSRDGKHWHVDANINGEKEHANLTNSQIMDILAYPAAKQDLRTQLIKKLRDISPHPIHDERPIFIAPNLGAPIIRMYEPREPRQHPKIEYIYKKGCSDKPLMPNNLSPLHESRIIPEIDGNSINLISNPMQSYNESGLSSIRIRKAKKKTKGRGRSKTVNKKWKR